MYTTQHPILVGSFIIAFVALVLFVNNYVNTPFYQRGIDDIINLLMLGWFVVILMFGNMIQYLHDENPPPDETTKKKAN